jgi:hypothetical protein
MNSPPSVKHLFPRAKKDKAKTSKHSIEDKHILEYLLSSFSYFELSSRLRRLSDWAQLHTSTKGFPQRVKDKLAFQHLGWRFGSFEASPRLASLFTSVHHLLKDLNPTASSLSIPKPIYMCDYNEILHTCGCHSTWHRYSNCALFNNNVDCGPGNNRYDLPKGASGRKCDNCVNKGQLELRSGKKIGGGEGKEGGGRKSGTLGCGPRGWV